MTELISLPELDDGPTDIRLEALFQLTKHDIPSTLGFVEDHTLKRKARDLGHLIDEYTSAQTQSPIMHKRLTTSSVASWIYHTNQIEHAGLATEGDTEALLFGKRQSVNSREDKEVLQTLSLLKKTYDISNHFSTNKDLFHIDSNVLKSWHQVLFDGIFSDAGEFRVDGRQSTTTEGDRHVFPHHALVKKSISNLCVILNNCRREMITKYQDTHNRVLYSFALAAFAQFHFVDIHPFTDGNGRMCRFLSKRFLDWVCPVPFPQFVSRTLYLKALDDCRKELPKNAPKPLLILLLDTAIEHYQYLLKLITQKSYTVLCACDSKELIELCREHNFSDEDLHQLLQTFANSKAGETFEFGASDKTQWRVKHFFDIDAAFDEL